MERFNKGKYSEEYESTLGVDVSVPLSHCCLKLTRCFVLSMAACLCMNDVEYHSRESRQSRRYASRAIGTHDVLHRKVHVARVDGEAVVKLIIQDMEGYDLRKISSAGKAHWLASDAIVLAYDRSSQAPEQPS